VSPTGPGVLPLSRSEKDPTSLVPHRPPVLCADSIVEAGADGASTELEVRDGLYLHGEEFCEEGFVEGCAQAAAALMASEAGGEAVRPRRGRLVAIRELRIQRTAVRGERVVFEAAIVKTIGNLALVRCRASAGAESLAQGEMTFFVEPGP